VSDGAARVTAFLLIIGASLLTLWRSHRPEAVERNRRLQLISAVMLGAAACAFVAGYFSFS
jgi:hypothetical protein